MRHIFGLSFIFACLTISGCGIAVPPLELNQHSEREATDFAANFVNSVATHVHCELRKAVYDTASDLESPWLYSWSAKVTLTLTVDEKSTLSPGLSLNEPLSTAINKFANGTTVMTSQIFNFGLGGAVGADATRVETISWFLDFADFPGELETLRDPDASCEIQGAHPIEGSMLIYEGLYSGVKTATVLKTVSQPFATGGQLSVIEHHITFDVNATGNATPTWKLVNVSANTGGSLISGSRDRKDDLLITMGPTEISDTKRKLATHKKIAGPSADVDNAHLAAQIGQAVATAIQGGTH